MEIIISSVLKVYLSVKLILLEKEHKCLTLASVSKGMETKVLCAIVVDSININKKLRKQFVIF